MALELVSDTANGSYIQTENGNIVPQGRRNYLINGNFDSWQYAISQDSGTDALSGYGSDDRWSNQFVGSYRLHSRQLSTDTERALFNSAYFSRTAVATSAGVNNIVLKKQHIENVTKLAGKTVTLSFWAKADASKNIAMEVVQVFGTGGSPSAILDKQNVTTIELTSTWQKKTITFTIPSIIGKTLGTDGVHTSYTQIRLWLDAGTTYNLNTNSLGNQSGTFDIAEVKLEDGSVATDGWHPYDGEFGGEIQACQRYYEVLSCTARLYSPVANTLMNTNGYFKSKKRVAPTIVQTGGARFNISTIAFAPYPTLDGGRLEITSQGIGDTYSIGELITASAEL